MWKSRKSLAPLGFFRHGVCGIAVGGHTGFVWNDCGKSATCRLGVALKRKNAFFLWKLWRGVSATYLWKTLRKSLFSGLSYLSFFASHSL